MIDAKFWVNELKEKLHTAFGARLLFLGLQGSYNRAEANEHSDIDIVLVLDELSLNDLEIYRRLLQDMPHSEKAGGFICGKQELLNWPKHEIFQLLEDTTTYHGNLELVTPDFTRADIERSFHISVANLYHTLCHSYLYDSAAQQKKALKGFYKAVFFPLQLAEYLRSGIYYKNKSALFYHLLPEEMKVMEISMNWIGHEIRVEKAHEEYFQHLISLYQAWLSEKYVCFLR